MPFCLNIVAFIPFIVFIHLFYLAVFCCLRELKHNSESDYRQAYTFEFLVYVECVDVGHSAYVVDNCH